MDLILGYGSGHQLDALSTELLRTDMLNQKPWIRRLIQVGDYYKEREKRESGCVDYIFSIAPNGSALRPNSPYQQALVRSRFRGGNVVIYCVPEGKSFVTNLPYYTSIIRIFGIYFKENELASELAEWLIRSMKEPVFPTTFSSSTSAQVTTLSSQQNQWLSTVRCLF